MQRAIYCRIFTPAQPDNPAASVRDFCSGAYMLDVSDFKHFRINHSELFADRQNHINGIENFWTQAKRHMRKFNGVPKAHFGLFLKACEWRFNTSDPSEQLTQIKQWVKRHLR